MTAKLEQSAWRKQAVSETKETIALFKAAWDHAQKHSRSNFGQDLTQTFACSALHVLCKPVQPIACTCKRRPEVQTEAVDLYTFPQALQLVVHPSLEVNQPYLDLLLHSPFHSTISSTDICHPLTVTFADVAAAAGNLPLLQHLFTSPQPCVRQFYAAHYTYENPEALLMLFVYAMNGGCHDVVIHLAEKFIEELTSDLKNSILEANLWLATTDKNLEVCFQLLVLKFGVNGAENSQYCPLYLACLYDDGDAASFLIDHDADMYAWDNRTHSLAYHAYQQGLYTFGIVAPFNTYSGYNPSFTLGGQHRVLRTMLGKGLCIKAVSVQGSHFRYPLMHTLLSHSQLDLVQHLVDCGHHVNMPIHILVDDKEQSVSPLVHSLACKSISSAEWLIQHGADVNKPSFFSQQLDDESWTPLHVAVTLGNLSIVRKLIQHGAHTDARTSSGETVLSLATDKIATSSECREIVSYLIQIGTPVQSVPGLSFLVKSRLEAAVKSDWSLLDLAVHAGDSATVEMLLRSRHFPHLFPKVSEFLQSIMRPESIQQRKSVKLVEDYVAEMKVPSLLLQCRDKLRLACGIRLQWYVKSTVMPAALRSYLLLEDLFGSLERQTDTEEGLDMLDSS